MPHPFILFVSSEPIWEEKKRWNHYKAVSNDLKVFLEEEFNKVQQGGGGVTRVVPIPNTDLKVSD